MSEQNKRPPSRDNTSQCLTQVRNLKSNNGDKPFTTHQQETHLKNNHHNDDADDYDYWSDVSDNLYMSDASNTHCTSDNDSDLEETAQERTFHNNWSKVDLLLKTVDKLSFKSLIGINSVENRLSRKIAELQFKMKDFSDQLLQTSYL